MSLETHIVHLLSWAQEESAAQARQIAVLEEMHSAVRAGDLEALDSSSSDLEEALKGAGARRTRRSTLTETLGHLWGVAPSTLTLTSIVERCEQAGVNDHGLSMLRDRLRTQALEVARLARLLSTLARHHRGVINDLVALLSGGETSGEKTGGVLVDARA